MLECIRHFAFGFHLESLSSLEAKRLRGRKIRTCFFGCLRNFRCWLGCEFHAVQWHFLDIQRINDGLRFGRHRRHHLRGLDWRRLLRNPGGLQGNPLAMQAQRIRRLAELLCVPVPVGLPCDVFNPTAKGLHGRAGGIDQFVTGRTLFGQPVVEQLLIGPGGFTEIVEPHHARAALERVECTAQGGLLGQIGRIFGQGLGGNEAVLHDFSGLFQKDVDQFCFVVRKFCRRYAGRRRNWDGRWRRDGGHNRRNNDRFGRCSHRRLRSGRCGLFHHRCALTPHQRLELAFFLVVHKQLLGQRALVAEHVDEEAHGSQAVAQLLENAAPCGGFVDIVHQELLDAGAHAQGCDGGLVQTQNRKHTTHLCQLAGHFPQWRLVLWVAEKLIQGPFHFTQRGTQFIHHTAHGLSVTDAPVQFLHPGFQRLRLAARAHMLQTLCQPGAAFGHVRVCGIQVIVGGFQIQDRGRDFHGDRGHRGAT